MLPIIPVLESIVVYSEEDAKVVKFGVPQSFFQKFSAVITDMAGSELFAKVASWSSTDV